MFATILSILVLCGFVAFLLYKTTKNDDDASGGTGGVGGGGVNTDRPRTQPV